MLRLVQIKEILIALGIFLIPMLIYCHLYFDDSNVTSIQIFDFNYVHKYISDEYFIYSFLRFSIPLSIFLILWSRSSLQLKILLSFPIYIVLWRSMGTLTPLAFQVKPIYFQLISISILLLALAYYKSNKDNSKGITRVKFKSKPQYLLVSVFLISLPCIYNLWMLFPEGTNSIDLYFFELKDYGFVDANSAFYVLLQKSCFLIPLLIYFLIIKEWWRYALLSPITLYANQIFNIFDGKVRVLDEFELTQSGPFLLALAIFLILLSKAVENQSHIKAFLESIYNKIEQKVARRFESRQHFIEEKRQKLNQSIDELIELEELKSELERELHKR